MKTIIISTSGLRPDAFKVGQEIDVSPSRYGDRKQHLFTDEVNCFVGGVHIELPLDRFKRLAKTANKIILANPGRGYTAHLLQTENYLIMYTHSKGNHWNISGNHYRYYHDINTGEFIPEYEAKKEEELYRQRILKADIVDINKIRKSTKNNPLN